jgi:hypothetical protein
LKSSIPIVCHRAIVTLPDADTCWQGQAVAAADGVAAAPGAADDEADDLHTHLAKDEADAWAAWQRQRDARESQDWSSSGWRQ